MCPVLPISASPQGKSVTDTSTRSGISRDLARRRWQAVKSTNRRIRERSRTMGIHPYLLKLFAVCKISSKGLMALDSLYKA